MKILTRLFTRPAPVERRRVKPEPAATLPAPAPDNFAAVDAANRAQVRALLRGGRV